MPPKKQQFKSTNRQIFNRLGTQHIRSNCCWNCFEVGHLRFQCPQPKIEICSFCRTSGVQSSNCSCVESRLHFAVPEQKEVDINNHCIEESVKLTEYGPIQENVIVPVNVGENIVRYIPKENMIVFVTNTHAITNEPANDEDRDILEIHPEDDCLDFI